MNSSQNSTFSCRLCQNYQVEGQRGGTCKILNVPVQSDWSACPLAIPYFAQRQCTGEQQCDRSDLYVTVEKILPLTAYEFPDTRSRRKVS